MNPGDLLESGVMMMAGIWITLVVYGRIRPPNHDSPKFERWLARFGRPMKVLGPFVIVFSALKIVMGLLGTPL
jgi:hypothetical protein